MKKELLELDEVKVPSRTNNPLVYIKTLFEITKEQVERKMRYRYLDKLLKSIDEFSVVNRVKGSYYNNLTKPSTIYNRIITVTEDNCMMSLDGRVLKPGTKIYLEGGYIKDVKFPS